MARALLHTVCDDLQPTIRRELPEAGTRNAAMIAVTLPLPISPETPPMLASPAAATTQPFAVVAAQALASCPPGQTAGDGNAAAPEQDLPPDVQRLPPGELLLPVDPGAAASFAQKLSRSLLTGGVPAAAGELPGDAAAAPPDDDTQVEHTDEIVPALLLTAAITTSLSAPASTATATATPTATTAGSVIAEQAPVRPSRAGAALLLTGNGSPRTTGPTNHGDDAAGDDAGATLVAADFAATNVPLPDPGATLPRRDLVGSDGSAVQVLAAAAQAAAAPRVGDGVMLPALDATAAVTPMSGVAASPLGGLDPVASGTATGSPAQTTLRLPQPLHDPKWPSQFATRVDWLTGAGVTDARIVINPPELGPIDVRISLQDEQAQIHITVQHDAVRDAVQESLPRLRELLQQSGLQLANADVSTGRHDHSRAASQPAITYLSLDDAEVLAESAPAGRMIAGSGFIDTYI